jgi:plastocyanin
MPGYLAPRVRSSSLSSVRGRNLVLSAAVLAASLAVPATLVGAQEPAAPTPTASEQPPSDQPDGESSSIPTSSSDGTQVSDAYTAVTSGGSTTQPRANSETVTTTPVAASSTATAAGSASVSILDGSSTDDYRFSPASITIAAGDTVTWTNNGQVPEGHDVKGDGFESGTLQSGQTYSHTFSGEGTFPYICSIHPFMKATVIVQGTGGSGGGGGASGGGGGSGSAPTGTSGTGATPSGTAPTSGAGSESAAGTSPDAAGTASQLPSTGLPLLPMLGVGAGLVSLGLLVRRRVTGVT